MKTNRFTINLDGTVTDTSTMLMWQQKSAGKMSWEEAIKYCEDLRLGGYNDWRVPNRSELISLVDDTKHNPAIDTITFPDTVSSYYWSSATYALGTGLAWCVDFYFGLVDYGSKSGSLYVRAVRGGQSGSFGDLAINKQNGANSIEGK